LKVFRITLYLLSFTVVLGWVLPYFGETYLPLIAERYLLPPEPDEPLPNEFAEPVVRLVLADGLVGSGNARRIVSLSLGPRTGQTRRLSLEWEGRADQRKRRAGAPADRRRMASAVGDQQRRL
jgi:hypothetical protein